MKTKPKPQAHTIHFSNCLFMVYGRTLRICGYSLQKRICAIWVYFGCSLDYAKGVCNPWTITIMIKSIFFQIFQLTIYYTRTVPWICYEPYKIYIPRQHIFVRLYLKCTFYCFIIHRG